MFIACRACGKRFAGDNIYALLEEMRNHMEEHRIRGNVPLVIVDEINTATNTATTKSNLLIY